MKKLSNLNPEVFNRYLGASILEFLIGVGLTLIITSALILPKFMIGHEKGQAASCASALGGVKTAQEIFMTDWDRYAKNLDELNNYEDRFNRTSINYIPKEKLLQICLGVRTIATQSGFTVWGAVKNRGNCVLIYTESKNLTAGNCDGPAVNSKDSHFWENFEKVIKFSGFLLIVGLPVAFSGREIFYSKMISMFFWSGMVFIFSASLSYLVFVRTGVSGL